MLKDNAQHYDASIETINQSFESISASDLNNVDFVFASMCPAVTTWEAVQKPLISQISLFM